MILDRLAPAPGAKRNRKRLGRGVGSGTGKTSGRGHKGQNSRSGGGVRPGFEGGQMPIHRRLPKRGFTNIFKRKFSIVNVRDLGSFEAGSVVDKGSLLAGGVVSGKRLDVKLLGQGDIPVPLTVRVAKASKGAVQKIEAAGGSVEIL